MVEGDPGCWRSQLLRCTSATRSMAVRRALVPEEGGYPIRVRAGMTPDAAIKDVAARFTPAIHAPVPAAGPGDGETTRTGAA